MANEGAGAVLIIKNPGVRPESHVHLVSHFKLQSHAIGCCLVASSSSMGEHYNHLLSVLHQTQPHWSSWVIMSGDAEVVDSFDWSTENTCRGSTERITSWNILSTVAVVLCITSWLNQIYMTL